MKTCATVRPLQNLFSPPLLLFRKADRPLRFVGNAAGHLRTFTATMGKKENITLKVPKGTKDWEGKDMVIRDKIFGTITNVFKRHGAVTIDT